MSELGKFTPVGYNDGLPPPINADNLNELERVVALCDNELARTEDIDFMHLKEYFYERNTYVFLYFTDYTDWTESAPAQTTLSDEQTNQLIGNDALKINNDLATAGWMSIYQTLSSTADLTAFFDGSASSTSDVILIYFYMSDGAAFSNLEFRFGDDFANSYWFDASGYIDTGWIAIYPRKSDFTALGAPTGWNNIDYIRIAPYVQAGYQNEYIYIQYIMLCRVDAIYSGYANCFQKYFGSVTGWVNRFGVSTDFCSLHRDHQDMIEKIGYMKLDAESDLTQLAIMEDMIYFIGKFEFYCKYAGESASIVWFVSSSVFAETYISSNTFYLDVNEGGGVVSNSVALEVNLIKNERFYIYFEKESQTFRSILKKDGEIIKILEYELTSVSDDQDGNIYLGQHSSISFSLLTDFRIGNKKINDLTNENVPRLVRMYKDQSFVNNTIANVNGLYAYLPTFKFYRIDLFIICSCSSATPDIKISWELTNCVNYTSRNAIGPPNSTTDVNDTTVRMSEFGMSTEIEYGIEAGADETLIKETVIILCEQLAGKVQIKAAQANTDAGNPTTIESHSFMTITPLNAQAHTNV